MTAARRGRARHRSTPRSRCGSAEPATGRPRIAYDADAVVGGMVGGVGQRMLSAVSKRMAGEFFGNVGSCDLGAAGAVAARPSAGRRAAEASGAQVFTAPARPGRRLAQETSSRASSSAPGWSLGVVVGSSSGGGGDVTDPGHRGSLTSGAATPEKSGLPSVTGGRMSDLTVDSTAARQVPPYGSRDLGARAARPAPDRIAERNPELNAIVSLDEERARDGAADADEALATRRPGRARCTGCRSRSRTPTRWRAGGRRTARRSSPSTCPTHDELIVERIRARGRRRRREDQRAGVRGRLPHLQHGLRHDAQPRRPDPLGRRFQRGRGVRAAPRAWCRSRTAPTWAARCATPRRSAAWSACAPASAGCPRGRSTTSGRRTRSAVRWRATSATSRCCSRSSPGPTRAGPPALGDAGLGVRPAAVPATLAGLRVASRPDLGGQLEVDHEVARRRRGGRPRGSRPPAPRVAAGVPRPGPGRRHLPHPARLALPGAARRAAGRPPRRFKRRSPTTSAPGEPDRRRRRARLRPAHRAVGAMRALLRRPRRAGAADLAGAAVPGGPGVPRPRSTASRWRLPRLDALGYFITVTGCPAISVPAGHTTGGLPVGVQLVAPHGADRRLLEVAAAFEEAGS